MTKLASSPCNAYPEGNTPYTLLAIMTTLCEQPRNDFILLHEGLARPAVVKWEGMSEMKNFWCMFDTPVDRDRLINVRDDFFKQCKWIYEDDNGIPRDTKHPGSRSASRQSRTHREMYKNWKLHLGASAFHEATALAQCSEQRNKVARKYPGEGQSARNLLSVNVELLNRHKNQQAAAARKAKEELEKVKASVVNKKPRGRSTPGPARTAQKALSTAANKRQKTNASTTPKSSTASEGNSEVKSALALKAASTLSVGNTPLPHGAAANIPLGAPFPYLLQPLNPTWAQSLLSLASADGASSDLHKRQLQEAQDLRNFENELAAKDRTLKLHRQNRELDEKNEQILKEAAAANEMAAYNRELRQLDLAQRQVHQDQLKEAAHRRLLEDQRRNTEATAVALAEADERRSVQKRSQGRREMMEDEERAFGMEQRRAAFYLDQKRAEQALHQNACDSQHRRQQELVHTIGNATNGAPWCSDIVNRGYATSEVVRSCDHLSNNCSCSKETVRLAFANLVRIRSTAVTGEAGDDLSECNGHDSDAKENLENW